MYQGKHISARQKKSRAARKKLSLALLSVLLVLAAVVGGTLAYLTDNTEEKVNTFEPGQVSCVVDEDFDGNTKKNVTIQSTSNVNAYIRAQIVVNWMDADGNISGVVPVIGTDYTLDLGTDWKLGTDGYYYYTQPVAPGNSTTNLIDTCSPVEDRAPEGYDLGVTIVAEAIQAEANAISEAWLDSPLVTE